MLKLIYSFCKGGIIMDDNKRRSIMKIETLKDETMQAIKRIIEINSDKRQSDTKKQSTTTIINGFEDIFKQKGIKVDEEYVQGQLYVLINEIEKGNRELDDDLLTQINRVLNKHIEYVIEAPEEERDLSLQRNESRTDDVLEEDKMLRHKKTNNNQIPKIEEYLHDIFGHEMRKNEYRGIRLTEANLEELRYEILNRLKYRSSERMISFFEGQNNELTENIKTKLSEFFEIVKQEVLQQDQQKENQQPRKSWELSEEEMKKIDPKKAVENLGEQQESRTLDKLEAMFK